MNYRGRHLDPISFWEKYVEFPPGTKVDDSFLPKVKCPNPAHDTLKSHFQINASQPTVHCFAHCGISGSYEHAICVIEGLYEKFKVDDASDEKERDRRTAKARRYAGKLILGQAKGLATGNEIRRAAKKSPRKAVTARLDLAATFDTFLPPVAREYLADRGISDNSVAKWGIGWDVDSKRVVIPIQDERGQLRLLIKRGTTARQQPKYLYWPEKLETGWGKSDLLFGACFIDPGMVRSSGLVLVEGSIDTILQHQDGFTNTVGILGTGISEAQVKIIARINPPKIFLFFDKDSAGVHNIEIAAKKLRKYPLYVVRYPKHRSDPAELTKAERVRQIGRAVPAFKFLNSLGLSVKTERNYSFG